MADWPRVKWSEASQVLDLLGDAGAADLPKADGVLPAAYFEQLRGAGRLADATQFLGHALPRLEAVAWAARTVRDLPPADGKADRADELALRATLFWIGDPTENRRYAAYNAAMACRVGSAERLAALAAFFSGGSIAPAELAPVHAPKEASNRFAAGAVMLAAGRTADMTGALAKALDAGVIIANRGLEPAAA
ncbi:MAG TPA: hypothetical protein VGM25_13600 [Caulobacteraceae bacterium]|jgi:hypothetical protein